MYNFNKFSKHAVDKTSLDKTSRWVRDGVITMDSKAELLTGKYKGGEAWVGCKINSHYLSNKPRWEVAHQTGLGWVILLVNEENLQLLGDWGGYDTYSKEELVEGLCNE